MWVPHFGPEDRAVFEARATELYEIVVASGGIKADDPRVTGDAESKAAFELLVRLNLLTRRGRRPGLARRRPRDRPVPGRHAAWAAQGAELL